MNDFKSYRPDGRGTDQGGKNGGRGDSPQAGARGAASGNAELAALIDAEKAADILSMPVFEELRGFTLSREREFLMSAPACELYGTACKDEILVQGAIDLMAVKGEECILVDYKYSSHDAERLKKDYAPQLKVYAAAAKRAAGVKNVRAYIVGILRGEWVQVL